MFLFASESLAYSRLAFAAESFRKLSTFFSFLNFDGCFITVADFLILEIRLVIGSLLSVSGKLLDTFGSLMSIEPLAALSVPNKDGLLRSEIG